MFLHIQPPLPRQERLTSAIVPSKARSCLDIKLIRSQKLKWDKQIGGDSVNHDSDRHALDFIMPNACRRLARCATLSRLAILRFSIRSESSDVEWALPLRAQLEGRPAERSVVG